MNIRKAVPEDASGIAIVHVDCWKTTYTNILPDEYSNQLNYEKRKQLWKRIFAEDNVFVAHNDKGDIIGFSSECKERSGNFKDYNGELSSIYILKKYQGQGIGKLLLKPIIKLLKNKGIYSMLVLVLEENGSRYFFEALGAKKIDTIELEICGKKLKEVVYGWNDINNIPL